MHAKRHYGKYENNLMYILIDLMYIVQTSCCIFNARLEIETTSVSMSARISDGIYGGLSEIQFSGVFNRNEIN